jgi:hypothetical protein
VRGLRVYIHSRLYRAKAAKSKFVDVKDPMARSKFVRSVMSNFVAIKEDYKLHGLPWAVDTSVLALKSGLLSFEGAMTLETVAAREVLEGKNTKLSIVWKDGKTKKQHTLHLTQLVADMAKSLSSLETCNAENRVSVSESIIANFASVHSLTKVLRDSFQLFVHMQSGPAYYPRNFVPDGLHLLIRWCEKLVNLESLLKVALLGSDDKVFEALESIKIRGKVSTEKKGKLETKKFKLQNTMGRDYATVCEHPTEMAAPYLEKPLIDSEPMYEYNLLVQMAYAFPYIVYRVTVDPEVDKTYGDLCTREELGLYLRDFGLAARYVVGRGHASLLTSLGFPLRNLLSFYILQ